MRDLVILINDQTSSMDENKQGEICHTELKVAMMTKEINHICNN